MTSRVEQAIAKLREARKKAASGAHWYSSGRAVYTDDLGAVLDLIAHCGMPEETSPKDRAAFIAFSANVWMAMCQVIDAADYAANFQGAQAVKLPLEDLATAVLGAEK